MTLELDPTIGTLPEIVADGYQTQVMTGKLVSFRYLAGALRRRRKLWIATTLIGLVLGSTFHVIVPRNYAAYSTLYMAHAPGTDDAVGMGNDLALLDNTSVARRAVRLLGEPSLGTSTLLGKVPGVSISDNVLTIAVSGPSYNEAVRRVNAVTSAYLVFRAQQYNAQDDAIVSGLNKQIASLVSQANKLTESINNSNSGSEQLTQLVDQRSEDQAEITNLQGTVQLDQLDTLSVVKATRVLTPGSTIYKSNVKLALIDSLSGVGGGLAVGLGFVVLQALASDRVRRREDVATILGASVGVSVGPRPFPSSDKGLRFGGRWFGRAGMHDLVAAPGPRLGRVVSYLESRLDAEPRRSLLAVAVDDVRLPAVTLAATATSLAAAGKDVVLVDLTADRVFESMFSPAGEQIRRVQIDQNAAITLFVPPRELGPEDDRAPWELSAERWQYADAVLALATVDLARGAWHLRGWDQAIIEVTAGRSTPQRISGTAELLRAAGVAVVSSILFDADESDESVGLVEIRAPWATPPLGDIPSTPPSWK